MLSKSQIEFIKWVVILLVSINLLLMTVMFWSNIGSSM